MGTKQNLFLALICFVAGMAVFLSIFKFSSPLVSTLNTTLKFIQPVYDDCKVSSALDLKTSPYDKHNKTCVDKLIDFQLQLNSEQETAVNKCIALYVKDLKEGHIEERRKRNLRYTSHKYLKGNGFMIEAGGHLGVDVNEFNSRYHPKTYVVLEPVRKFYNHLKQRFNASHNIILMNYGLDVEDGEFVVDSSSNDGTSLYKKKRNSVQNEDAIKVMSVSKFLCEMKIDERDIDLLTLNCEGCEYAVLDYLLSSGKIYRVKNIQFQSHRIPGICQPVKRFCWYQQLLSRSHKLVYQFKFVWESWTRL